MDARRKHRVMSLGIGGLGLLAALVWVLGGHDWGRYGRAALAALVCLGLAGFAELAIGALSPPVPPATGRGEERRHDGTPRE